jgi:hypothetical protein
LIVVLGDRTGQLHLRSHQTAWIEYVESIKNVTEAPLSYIIDYGSEVIFPTEVWSTWKYVLLVPFIYFRILYASGLKLFSTYVVPAAAP